jgi:hypothetical protein
MLGIGGAIGPVLFMLLCTRSSALAFTCRSAAAARRVSVCNHDIYSDINVAVIAHALPPYVHYQGRYLAMSSGAPPSAELLRAVEAVRVASITAKTLQRTLKKVGSAGLPISSLEQCG